VINTDQIPHSVAVDMVVTAAQAVTGEV
jgi:hypothetical protein